MLSLKLKTPWWKDLSPCPLSIKKQTELLVMSLNYPKSLDSYLVDCTSLTGSRPNQNNLDPKIYRTQVVYFCLKLFMLNYIIH